MKKGTLAIVAVLLLFGMYGCSSYNGLVGKDNNVQKLWADVQTQYQRRSDLIGTLVKTVQGAADFEKGTANARIEIRKDNPDGMLMGTLLVNNESISKNFGKVQTFLRGANGTHDVYLVVKTSTNEKVTLSNPRFFAGSPKQLKQ